MKMLGFASSAQPMRATATWKARRNRFHTIAAQDEHLGLVFPARVRLQQVALVIDGTKVRLTPGMNLSVEIKTGKQRVIDNLLSPLQTHSNEAFNER